MMSENNCQVFMGERERKVERKHNEMASINANWNGLKNGVEARAHTHSQNTKNTRQNDRHSYVNE